MCFSPMLLRIIFDKIAIIFHSIGGDCPQGFSREKILAINQMFWSGLGTEGRNLKGRKTEKSDK